jgi:hypothetical protein
MKMYAYRKNCSQMLISLFLSQRWKQPKFLVMDRWINKMWHGYTTWRYSVIKRNDLLMHATELMNLERYNLNDAFRHRRLLTMIQFIWNV